MIFAILCILISSAFVFFMSHGDKNNPNGFSVSLLQILLLRIQKGFMRHPKLSAFIFVYPKLKEGISILDRQLKIEKLVWSRLFIVSCLALLVELFVSIEIPHASIIIRSCTAFYILLLQGTLFLALLRPLFGVVLAADGISLDEIVSKKTTPQIPSPRRSLFMALVNFAEIVISWGIIYRCLVPNIVTTMDQANYFSVVTFTTLGYGDINAGSLLMLQLAITLNMLVFLVFTICHFTTIMGAMSSNNE